MDSFNNFIKTTKYFEPNALSNILGNTSKSGIFHSTKPTFSLTNRTNQHQFHHRCTVILSVTRAIPSLIRMQIRYAKSYTFLVTCYSNHFHNLYTYKQRNTKMKPGKPNHDNSNNKMEAHDKFELRKGRRIGKCRWRLQKHTHFFVDFDYNLIRHTYKQNSSYLKKAKYKAHNFIREFKF